MKFSDLFLILLFLLSFQINGFSYTRIYLMSEVELNKENVMLSDICKMEGDNINSISNIIISPELYSDSIVDNKELYDLLSNSVSEKLFIFGSGVKIKINLVQKEVKLEKPVLIVKGEEVELSLKKNGITIDMKGKALSNGFEKDEIDFRLTTGKVIKGRVISLKKADIIL